MAKKLIFFSLLLPLFSVFQILHAQQDVIATAGKSAEASGTELEWTVGEVMVESYSSSENELTQGVLRTQAARSDTKCPLICLTVHTT